MQEGPGFPNSLSLGPVRLGFPRHQGPLGSLVGRGCPHSHSQHLPGLEEARLEVVHLEEGVEHLEDRQFLVHLREIPAGALSTLPSTRKGAPWLQSGGRECKARNEKSWAGDGILI